MADFNIEHQGLDLKSTKRIDAEVPDAKYILDRGGIVLSLAHKGRFKSGDAEDLDYVVIMSVNPGFGGQSFIKSSLEKIRQLRKKIDDLGLSTIIQIDGGVSENTIEEISIAGTDSFVAGSAVYGSSDYKKTLESFRSKTNK